VTSRYVAHPKLTVSETSERILELLGDNPAGSLALSLFNRAAGRVGAMERLFLEVQEKDTPRQSFDLKLYDAGFTTADIPVASLATYFGIDDLRVPAAALGHIAGGRGRDGNPFLTLYYGGGRA
jgi:tryptophan halogenase